MTTSLSTAVEATMSDLPTRTALSEALGMEVDGTTVHTAVRDGFDVFGIPHGGYLAALAAKSVLAVSGQPDLFTVTTHFLRKAVVGPMEVTVVRLGASRRFATWQALASQDGQVVVAALASVGDRTTIDGPTWSDLVPWDPTEADLSAPAGHPDLPFTAPRVAEQFGQRISLSTAGFALGHEQAHARLRAVVEADEVDQLTALVACDLTPPAAWNPLGSHGWVPTVELTVHLRARPSPGPMTVDVSTHHVRDGFLEEDALVHDATGTLVAQSRQLARWTGP